MSYLIPVGLHCTKGLYLKKSRFPDLLPSEEAEMEAELDAEEELLSDPQVTDEEED